MILHRPRHRLGISTTINGPGYYFAADLVKDGWPTSTITEDIDLSFSFVERGVRIGFCEDAEFYDEQPTKIKQSMRQKLRWGKGYLQNFKKHFCKLIKRMFTSKSNKKEKWSDVASCYDMSVQVFPTSLINWLLLLAFRFLLILGVVLSWTNNTILALLISWGISFLVSWFGTMGTALLVMLRERKHIKISFIKALWYAFMFPTYDRVWKYVLFIGLFKKVEWKPIEHKESISIEDVKR